MFSKLLFIVMRGLSLFSRYLKGSLVSMIALAALFTMFHAVFALGFAMAGFASGAARFDTIRAYAPQEKAEGLKPLLSVIDGVADIKIYTPADTKKYIEQNAPSISSVKSLPEELFPAFIELTVKDGFQNVESLRSLSKTISEVPGIDSVSYGEEWAEQMAKGKKAVFALLTLAATMFIIVGVVITYQTISVTLFQYRKEVQVYSIVGGTSVFITLPFVVVAGCMALLCSLFSLAVYSLLHYFLLAPISEATGLHISLTPAYWLLFILVTAAISKTAGYVSAASFLRKAYNEE